MDGHDLNLKKTNKPNSKESRVLITGACGSIGSNLVKRLLSDGHIVCAFDQNEDGLFKLDQRYREEYAENLKLFVGNVRDESRLSKAMENVDVVFHCAALKHVYLSEYNPFEAMQTNIIGTNNVINASIAANVRKVVFTSSDKAVNPSSTMGATKLLGERLITAANNYSGKHTTKFSSVRFGNVLDTNGSVLQIFKEQIKENQPLTITSTDMTRFFITMDQSISLCLYAKDHMIGGEIFIMHMGCCNIIGLAKAISGDKDFKYNIIGQKSGEKSYEELVTESEVPRTVCVDDTYIIIPDTLSIMQHAIRDDYKKSYDKLIKLSRPLRSDESMLTDTEISEMLKTNNLI